jgi:hypothetical protein
MVSDSQTEVAMAITDILHQQDRFIEQAEYLEPNLFMAWTTEHPEEELILRKLTQTGAKLITGPRGSGKTTLLLKAFYMLLNDNRSGALPIYVNFKSSLKLEPLYRNNANAVFLFNQWLLLKLYQGIYSSLSEMQIDAPKDLLYSKKLVDRVAGQLELGQVDNIHSDQLALDVNIITEEIAKLLDYLDKSRCILLFDDAAHAFSTEQQRDFFDFFRQIKSRIISPKAAIYPGVTIYSSTFHVGHDAEMIDIWMDPQSEQYIPFLFSLLEKRLPLQVFLELKKSEEMLKLVCYASFGMPRTLLNMVRTFFTETEEEETISYKINFNRKRVMSAIKNGIDNTTGLFRSLQVKLPLYANFIKNGEVVFFEAVESIKKYNRGKDVGHQSVSVAIQKPLPSELSRVMGFFQYSGLVMPMREVSRGEKGVFELFALHYASLIDRNALLGKKSVNIGEFVEAFSSRHPHEFTRVSPKTLVRSSDFSSLFSLSLPPCHVCATPRINEHARFCLHCGTQLKSISSFESIVSRDISELDLTQRRVQSIKQNSRIRTIKDVLMDHEFTELRGVPQIGPKWAQRIYAYAEESIG